MRLSPDLPLAPAGSPARRELLPALLRLERFGSTGLASAMAHLLTGAPLPIAARRDDGAVALELKALGSRAYVRSSSTARRLGEAAFLPIQAPTEAQLRAELAAADRREQHDLAAV